MFIEFKQIIAVWSSIIVEFKQIIAVWSSIIVITKDAFFTFSAPTSTSCIGSDNVKGPLFHKQLFRNHSRVPYRVNY